MRGALDICVWSVCLSDWFDERERDYVGGLMLTEVSSGSGKGRGADVFG